MGIAMNRRNFLSSLLALIPIPFLTRRERPSVRKNPEEAFKETAGRIVEARYKASQRFCEQYVADLNRLKKTAVIRQFQKEFSDAMQGRQGA